MAPVRKVHDRDFLIFLETAWGNGPRPAIAARSCRPAMRRAACSSAVPARSTARPAITACRWKPASPPAPGMRRALRPQPRLPRRRLVANGDRAAFALCRPPGHHAHHDMYGGYCFLNNAAIAAQAFRDAGAARVAILDVDFHHGNGTQDIFYARDDVLFCSLHGAARRHLPLLSRLQGREGPRQGRRLQRQLSDAAAHRLRRLGQGA